MKKTQIEIPMKLPSINEYIAACKIQKGKWNKGNQMKQDYQKEMIPFFKDIPEYTEAVKIDFTWVEKNRKRDLDNICWAKKFILDALVQAGKIPDDSQTYVGDFEDHFELGSEYKVILKIKKKGKEKCKKDVAHAEGSHFAEKNQRPARNGQKRIQKS